MAGWGQRWAAACGRECVASAPRCRPTAHEHEGRPAGRKRGVQGGRCPSVGAAREAGRPGPWESVVWGGEGGAGGARRHCQGAERQCFDKVDGIGGLVGGAAGCRRGHESQGRHAGSNGVRKCGGRSGGFAADQAVLWNIIPREDEGWW